MEKIAREKPSQNHQLKEAKIEELRGRISSQLQSLTSNNQYHENPSEKDKEDNTNLPLIERKRSFARIWVLTPTATAASYLKCLKAKLE
jgi:hypothetical protein